MHNGLTNEITFIHREKKVCTLSFNTLSSGKGPSANETKERNEKKRITRKNP